MSDTVKQYRKKAGDRATIGESQALARGEAYPAIVGTRFALILSLLALVIASVALAVAVSV